MSGLSRRGFLASSAALAACGRPAGLEATPDKPNVVVILLDQLRACSLSTYGDPNIRTPAMDAMLDSGVRVEHAIAANPLCGPARASLLTGMYPHKVGVPTNDRQLAAGTQTLASAFRKARYHCGYVGKWHLGPSAQQEPRNLYGFDDHFEGYNERYEYRKSLYHRGTDPTPLYPDPRDTFEPVYQTTQALEVMERWKEHPFLLMVSYAPPHPPPNWRADWAPYFPPAFPYGVDPAALSLRANVPAFAEGPHRADGDKRPSPGARAFLRNYYGAILSMEPQIQRLHDGLERLGIQDRTVVVFTSDHGDLAGSHGRYLKQKPYEESVRIPLGFRWPGTLKPRVLQGPVSQVDVFPTLAGLAGIPIDPVQGRDLSGVLRDGTEPAESVVSGCHLTNTKNMWWQVRNGRYSYTEYASGKEGPLLFDMQQDPYQLHNLAGEPEQAELQQGLSAELATRRARIDA